MTFYKITSDKDEAISLRYIDSYGCVIKNCDDNLSEKPGYELWLKTNGVDNPWDSVVIHDFDKTIVQQSTPNNRDFCSRRNIIEVINKIKNGELFLRRICSNYGDYSSSFSKDNRCYMIESMIIDDLGVIPDESKNPCRYFESIKLSFNPFYDDTYSYLDLVNSDDIIKYPTLTITDRNDIIENGLFKVVDFTKINKIVVYRDRHSGLYYAKATIIEDDAEITILILDNNIDEYVRLGMFTSIDDLNYKINSLRKNSVYRLVKTSYFIKAINITNFRNYMYAFEEDYYIYPKLERSAFPIDLNFDKNSDINSNKHSSQCFIMTSKDVDKLYYKEFRDKKLTQYKLFTTLTNDSKIIHIQIGSNYNDMTTMRSDIKKFIDDELFMSIELVDGSYSAKFLESYESDYNEIDLKRF